jgi:hypothetical protein
MVVVIMVVVVVVVVVVTRITIITLKIIHYKYIFDNIKDGYYRQALLKRTLQ